MKAGEARVGPEELAEIESLSRAQLRAAKAGDLEAVRRLLGNRRQLLAGLISRGASPQQLADLVAGDAETRRELGAQMRRVEESLARLHEGRRLLQGYGSRIAVSPGFVDQRR